MERLALLVFLAVCSTTIAIANNVIDPQLSGTVAKPGQFPYAVFFKHKTDNYSYAGGAIISSRHILTSANSLNIYFNQTFVIMVGCVEVTSPYCQQYEVQETIQHPNYTGQLKDNIGVVVLAEDIEFNKFVRIIALSSMHVEQNTSMNGTGVDLVSWVVKWNELTSISEDACQAEWPEADLSISFCTVPYAFAGAGTYGFPLVAYEHVVGISMDFCLNNDIVLRVGPYLLWLLNLMQNTK